MSTCAAVAHLEAATRVSKRPRAFYARVRAGVRDGRTKRAGEAEREHRCLEQCQARVPLRDQLVAEDGRGPQVGQAIAKNVLRRLRGLGLRLGALLRRQNRHGKQHAAQT